MLKSVRYGGVLDSTRNVHWLHALAAATSIVSSAPSRSSAAKSTAYDTDIVEPLLASGSVTLNAEASDEKTRSAANRKRTSTPVVRTAPTNTRAARGRSFITSAGEPNAS